MSMSVGISLGIGIGGIGVSGGGGLTFLLRDDFTTAASAPLTSPRTCDPGPGTLTITDTNNKLSTSSGNLAFATGGVGVGDPGAWGAQRTRVMGLAVVAKVSTTASGVEVGWDNAQSGAIQCGLRIANLSNMIRDGGNLIGAETPAHSTAYSLAAVLRPNGWMGFVKGGVLSEWSTVWISLTDSGDFYPALVAHGATSIAVADTFRVLQLPAPYATDYGIATQRLSGSQSAGQTFTHEANCVLEFTDTTRPSASNLDFRFRRQDSTNYWQVTINSSGDFTLNEVVAGTPTQRQTAAGVVTSGHRIVIVADSTTIKGYSNATLRWTHPTASNFATATAGELTALGTSGVVSDVVAWPRVLSGAAASILDLAVA